MGVYAWLQNLKQSLLQWKRDKYLSSLVNNGLKLGRNVKIVDTFFFDPAHCYLISIGDNTTLAPNVRLIAHDASTKHYLGYSRIGKIVIGANCFIGDSVIVLPGNCIGDGCIVGAGSVVVHDVPADSVAVGVPAKVICSRQEYLKKVEASRGQRHILSNPITIGPEAVAAKERISMELEGGIGFME